MQRVVEGPLQLAGDRPRLAPAHGVVVDLADGHQLGRRAGQEHLVGQVQLAAVDVAVHHAVPEVLGDRAITERAVDPVEDARGRRGGGDLAVADDEDVLARALAHVADVVEQDRLLVPGLLALDLGQDAVEVLPGRLRVRDQGVAADAPPRGDLRANARAACPPRRGRPPTPRRRSRRPPARRAGRGPSGRSRGTRSGGCSRSAGRCARSARASARAAPPACREIGMW